MTCSENFERQGVRNPTFCGWELNEKNTWRQLLSRRRKRRISDTPSGPSDGLAIIWGKLFLLPQPKADPFLVSFPSFLSYSFIIFPLFSSSWMRDTTSSFFPLSLLFFFFFSSSFFSLFIFFFFPLPPFCLSSSFLPLPSFTSFHCPLFHLSFFPFPLPFSCFFSFLFPFCLSLYGSIGARRCSYWKIPLALQISLQCKMVLGLCVAIAGPWKQYHDFTTRNESWPSRRYVILTLWSIFVYVPFKVCKWNLAICEPDEWNACSKIVHSLRRKKSWKNDQMLMFPADFPLDEPNNPMASIVANPEMGCRSV